MGFQTAWSESTPGERHITWSGHRTPCDLSVIEAKPVYDSKPSDVTCRTCGGYLMFDVEAARKAAVEHVTRETSPAHWDSPAELYGFTRQVAELVAGVAWQVKREHGTWNTNHVFSEFMAQGGLMTDMSPEARLIGSSAQAVLEVLTESNE
ncbi:hypothetical protein ACWDBD_38760 [Streptomyces sp. NPDC001118]|uniref:hypothetical protein n=1 Tax=Streptomyces sp. NPDC001127 TaxID=3154377 RepID=UPI003321793E